MDQKHFHITKSDGYVLSQGYHRATARLNVQYLLLQKTLNFTIHPSIELPDSPVIADVATGTTLWALDVSRKLPDAQIHALDKDITQGPPKEWLPPNVQIGTWDILQDPPNELLGKFDLIHVRLIFLVLAANKAGPVIQRLHSMLKPGGWLQWEEMDSTRVQVRKVSPSIATPAMDAILALKWSGGQHHWVKELPGMLKEEGFVACGQDKYDDPLELSRAFTDMHLMSVEEVALHVRKAGEMEHAEGFSAERIMGLATEGHRESQSGAALSYGWLCHTARKP